MFLTNTLIQHKLRLKFPCQLDEFLRFQKEVMSQQINEDNPLRNISPELQVRDRNNEFELEDYQDAIPNLQKVDQLKLNGDGNLDLYIGDSQYLEPKYYLALTDKYYLKLASEDGEIKFHDLEPSIERHLFQMQFLYMIENGVEVDDALPIAVMRSQMIKMGGLFRTAIRCVQQNEVKRITDQQYIALFAKHRSVLEKLDDVRIIELSKAYALFAIVMSAIVFKRTGHHYTQGSDAYYEKMERSTFDKQALPSKKSIVYRTATHPFGVKALDKIADLYVKGELKLREGKVPVVSVGLALRYNSLPAGMAALGIVTRVLLLMEAHSWFGVFYKHFHKHITLIRQFEDTVKDQWRKYHNSAGLYGEQKQGYEVVKSYLEEIAPFIIGYIKTMGSQSSLSQSKAIQKVVDSSNPLIQKFSDLVKADYAQTMSQTTIESLFADMENAQQKSAEQLEQEKEVTIQILEQQQQEKLDKARKLLKDKYQTQTQRPARFDGQVKSIKRSQPVSRDRSQIGEGDEYLSALKEVSLDQLQSQEEVKERSGQRSEVPDLTQLFGQ